MLRISEHASSAAAKSYYTSHLGSALGDYYRKDMDIEAEVIGQIHGKLAEQLNISGTMTEQQFFALIDNVHPVTGEKLTKRMNGDGNRRVGWDVYFDMGGKSLSAYYAATKDQRVLNLFDEAVQETMEREIESRMAVRVRQHGQNTSRTVGNAVWTSFTHLTTRPTRVKDEASGKWVETGTADPSIHQHVFVPNAVWDAEYQNRDGSQGAYLAAEITDGIWKNADYLQQNFHSRLARKLRDAGFNIRRTEHGLDLVGWDEEMDQAFSRRKHEIEAWVESRGIKYAADKAKGGKATRASKDTLSLTMEEQFDEWRDRLPEATWSKLLDAKGSDGGNWPEISEDQAIDYGLAHRLERDNSATLEEVMMAALDRGMGSVDVDSLQSRLLSRDDVVSARMGNELFISTQEMLALEQKVRDWAIHGQGTCLPLGTVEFVVKPFAAGEGNMAELNDNQKSAIKTLLSSTSRVMTLKGSPGVGKTTVLAQLFRGVEENGGRVISLGATSNARDVMIKDGKLSGNQDLQNARTLAKFLSDDTVKAQVDSQTLVVLDEATLAGLKDIDRLAGVIEERGGRLLLVGDYRQNDAVPRHGKIFEQLSRVLKPSAELTEIVRQRDKELRVAASLSSGGNARDVQAGFDKLVALGSVREFEEQKDRTEQAAKLYLEITGEKKHRRGKRLNWTVKQKRDAAMYRSGQTVVIGKGKQAVKLEVIGREAGDVMVMPPGGDAAAAFALDLSQAAKFDVYHGTYRDAIIVVGTHRDGERITAKIREARRQAGELGFERKVDRLESLGFSNAEKQNPDKYQPGQTIEFSQKAKASTEGEAAARSIGYGERFQVVGRDEQGRVLMQNPQGETLLAPLRLSERFDVLEELSDRLAVGDRIRMTKNGKTLPEAGRDGVRFSNNDTFTVTGFDEGGNPVIGNGHTLSKDFCHWRSGYYTTAFSAQGTTASHTVFVDSKEAGRSRSMESYLVAITRGKHAATLITDDIYACRNFAIVRSSQRPSATELADVRAKERTPAAPATAETERMAKQASMLKRVGEFAKLAAESTMEALRQAGGRMAEQVRQTLQQHWQQPIKDVP